MKGAASRVHLAALILSLDLLGARLEHRGGVFPGNVPDVVRMGSNLRWLIWTFCRCRLVNLVLEAGFLGDLARLLEHLLAYNSLL